MHRFMSCFVGAVLALAREGLEIETSESPQHFAAFIAKEIPFWAKVVRESGATAD